ncbi:methyltransferase [Bradyrhizobium jicamae]|uniref:Methyltransferase n=1 Tax=Bradyrhizobium jicamae TaxID=280332 RepID=A0ABS5FV62_9BRAD|nr:methyltransferase [Bradyrhizobium jicamae]MBR0800722.1 methyltransferase [Bradyrhizobium jicamae]
MSALPPSNHSPDDLPIRIGTAQEFAQVRAFFCDAQFDERTVCAAFNVGSVADIRSQRYNEIDYRPASSANHAAIELFLRGRTISRTDFQKISRDSVFAAFCALGLVRGARRSEMEIVCPVWLYPVDGFVIASDRRDDADGGEYCPPADSVFPALDTGTLKLLSLLPNPDGDALDLCGGCGIGALHLSRTARTAVSADIAERSAHFAEFNAHLNGMDIESAAGDLYAPVLGRQFDLIAAHPPWVPSIDDAIVFRDGGDGGETIIRRIIEGIPLHLRRGGTAVMVSLGRDTSEAGFESRVRRWLGERGSDCDVILGVERLMSIEDVVGSIRRLHLKDDQGRADRLLTDLRRLGTEKFVYGGLFIRRTDAPIVEPPLRLRMLSRARASDFDRLFAWRGRRRFSTFADWMKSAKPRLVPHLEINDGQLVEYGALLPGQIVLRAEQAFSAALKLESWLIPMIGSLDGDRTVEMVFAGRSNQSPANFTLTAFIDLAALMVELGFLELDFPAF